MTDPSVTQTPPIDAEPTWAEPDQSPSVGTYKVQRHQYGRGTPPGPARETGICGIVPAMEGYTAIISERWGGGIYSVRGRGKAPDLFEIPGPSKPIRPDAEDEDEDWSGYSVPPPQPQVVLGPGGQPFFMPPQSQQFPIQPPPGWWSMSQSSTRELDKAQAEVERQRQTIERLRDEVRQLERGLADERQKAALAELEARLSKGKQADGTDPKYEIAAIQARAEAERQRIEAKRDAEREAWERRRLDADGATKTSDLVDLAKSLNTGKSGTAQMQELLETQLLLKELTGGGDESTTVAMVRMALPEIRKILTAQRAEHAAAEALPTAQNPPPKRINGTPSLEPQQQQEDDPMVGFTQKIVAKIVEFGKQLADPMASAIAVRAYAQGLGEQAEAWFLNAAMTSNSTTMREYIEQHLPGVPEGAYRDTFTEVLALLKQEEHARWFDEFVRCARPKQ